MSSFSSRERERERTITNEWREQFVVSDETKRRGGEEKEEETRKCLYDSRRAEGLVRFDLHAVNRSHLPTRVVKSESRRVFQKDTGCVKLANQRTHALSAVVPKGSRAVIIASRKIGNNANVWQAAALFVIGG